ncbi:translation initiation factor IF-2-like [Cervus canadensis]|uniref:translation initiation factor IF-2-like n=1 Tax=Cervus canadensis TaxID=1574408 RepID=UPI001C9E5BA4|nr:translation initiation factor IF-2-like [Cervus canadensis]
MQIQLQLVQSSQAKLSLEASPLGANQHLESTKSSQEKAARPSQPGREQSPLPVNPGAAARIRAGGRRGAGGVRPRHLAGPPGGGAGAPPAPVAVLAAPQSGPGEGLRATRPTRPSIPSLARPTAREEEKGARLERGPLRGAQLARSSGPRVGAPRGPAGCGFVNEPQSASHSSQIRELRSPHRRGPPATPETPTGSPDPGDPSFRRLQPSPRAPFASPGAPGRCLIPERPRSCWGAGGDPRVRRCPAE